MQFIACPVRPTIENVGSNLLFFWNADVVIKMRLVFNLFFVLIYISAEALVVVACLAVFNRSAKA